jgi:hypothetical protein
MDISSILGSDEVKKHIKDATYPLVKMVYNEIYIYVWFICIYNIFLLSLVVINLYLLIRYVRIEKHIIIPDSDLA